MPFYNPGYYDALVDSDTYYDLVAYFGHAYLEYPLLSPSTNYIMGAETFAQIFITRPPAAMFFYGCNTKANGFTSEIASKFPGMLVFGQDNFQEVKLLVEDRPPWKVKAISVR